MVMFSILIPVYNAEMYLERCLASVCMQTIEDFEVILVNDGSQDDSGDICNRYAKRDNRFKVVHQNNQGTLISRKNACQIAKGKYVIYLDSDDFWERNLLERVKEQFDIYKSDVVLFDWFFVSEQGEKLGAGYDAFLETKVFDNMDEIIKKILSTEVLNSLCMKAFRRECIENTMEDLEKLFGISMGEDMAQCFIWLNQCKHAVYIKERLYNYRRNPCGTSMNYTVKMFRDICFAREFIYENLQNGQYGTLDNIYLLEQCFLQQFLTGLVRIAVKEDTAALKKNIEDIRHTSVYEKSIKQKRDFLTLKRRILLFLEQHDLWTIFQIVSKGFIKLEGKG